VTWISGLRRWMAENRRATRVPDPLLSVWYSSAGVALNRPLENISASGAFVVTEDDWMPGTLIHLVLLRGAENHFGIWAKVVRRDPRGLGVLFLFANARERRSLRQFLRETIREKKLKSASVSEAPPPAVDGNVVVIPGPESRAAGKRRRLIS
jgi:hypothetical protein